jgi:hypothetical protein
VRASAIAGEKTGTSASRARTAVSFFMGWPPSG